MTAAAASLLCIIMILGLIFVPYGFNAIQKKAIEKYEKFSGIFSTDKAVRRNAFENIVIYETDTDTYVVFPFMYLPMDNYVYPLSDGTFLVSSLEKDETEGFYSVFIFVDINGNATQVDITMPEEYAITYLHSLKYENNQLIFYRTRKGITQAIIFDIDKNHNSLSFSSTYEEKYSWSGYEDCKYDQKELGRTDFFDLYLKEHCFLWQDKARTVCMWTCVFRISK